MTTYDPSHQGFEIKLDHEQKVIRLGSYFYDLKGVLIREATDEDRQKYYCNKYVTFPIVDNDWLVYDGDAITDNGFGSQRYQLEPIPKDWFYTVQTLEGEINRELEELHKKHPNEYNKGKRPDVFEEKK